MSSVDEIMATADADQVAMMEERVILLSRDDEVIGHASKKESHLNESIKEGMLHRAFSVFLFTPDDKLILQKRSPAKITFPDYWANTCCSHPLYRPEELIAEGQRGVINAARRKLEQELGVPPEDVPVESFTFLTRVHYEASSDGIWGEHEIDYILICRPGHHVRFDVNPNEVAEIRAFERHELREWVNTANERGDLVSPWFRIIEQSLLHKWWAAMDNDTLQDCVEPDTIHRAPELLRSLGIDPASLSPPAPLSAPAPIAAPSSSSTSSSSGSSSPASTSAVAKQGAYGKIPTHKHSVLSQLINGSEVLAVLKYKLGMTSASKVAKLPADAPESLRWCEEKLCQVSRSFAVVICQLPHELRVAICNFYLVLRGLDTVEDDMENFSDNEVKLAHLRAFSSYLEDPDWCLDGIGEGHERELLQQFYHVTRVFQSLPAEQQKVISEITARMGEGMSLYCGRDLRQGTDNIADYNMYCHFVAGLVGEGLSRLFAASGREDASLGEQIQLANDMGLFLQKVNIIRDYLEDYVEGRAFWPKEIWGQYASELGEFAYKPTPKAMSCLHHMITDALSHAPASLRYLTMCKDPSVFRFCAIPQVMAIATLEELAGNTKVFGGVVKIRKGKAVKLLIDAGRMENVYDIFLQSSRSILSKISSSSTHVEPSVLIQLNTTIRRVERVCLAALPFRSVRSIFTFEWALVAMSLLALLLRVLYASSRSWNGRLVPRITDSWDVAATAGAVLCCCYLVAFAGVPLVLMVTPSLSSPDALKSAFKDAGVKDEDELQNQARAGGKYFSWHQKEAVAKGAALPPAGSPSPTSSPVQPASRRSARSLRRRT